MSDEQVRHHFQWLQQHIAARQQADIEAWEELQAALEDLNVTFEEMQAQLEVAEVVEEELLQQNQQLTERYHHYCELFQSSPIAYLVTDANGVILEANQAIAHLLNLPQHYLSGKPLVLYVAETDRADFSSKLNQLPHSNRIQVWQTTLQPHRDQPLPVELHLDPVREDSGWIEHLRIGVYRLQASIAPQASEGIAPQIHTQPSQDRLPQALDGLRVLVVDDEADAREFITAVLQPYGIGVKAVASAADALEAIEQFHPDVLVSDIRMPGEDGYRLIQRIRALEGEQGGHLPAAAITAYLDEDREKALRAGFEAYLHKLAHPIEMVEMVAQLARRATNFDRSSLK